jgi:hypothetical protein
LSFPHSVEVEDTVEMMPVALAGQDPSQNAGMINAQSEAILYSVFSILSFVVGIRIYSLFDFGFVRASHV